MITVDALRAFGANTEEGLGRCLNNETFYLRLVGMALDDANFAKLEDAAGRGDKNAATTEKPPSRPRTRSRACWAIWASRRSMSLTRS